jgi:hypothetical protein
MAAIGEAEVGEAEVVSQKKRNNLLFGTVFEGFLSRRRGIWGRKISWNNRLNWGGRVDR